MCQLGNKRKNQLLYLTFNWQERSQVTESVPHKSPLKTFVLQYQLSFPFPLVIIFSIWSIITVSDKENEPKGLDYMRYARDRPKGLK